MLDNTDDGFEDPLAPQTVRERRIAAARKVLKPTPKKELKDQCDQADNAAKAEKKAAADKAAADKKAKAAETKAAEAEAKAKAAATAKADKEATAAAKAKPTAPTDSSRNVHVIKAIFAGPSGQVRCSVQNDVWRAFSIQGVPEQWSPEVCRKKTLKFSDDHST